MMSNSASAQSFKQANDLDRTFGEICPTAEEMKSQILEIARRQVRRDVAGNWLKHLRFIVIGGLITRDILAVHYSLTSHDSLSEPSLPISRIKIVANSTAYVAVSYCWQREIVEQQIVPEVPDSVEDINGRRPWRAPKELLHRVNSFALYHSHDLVWIDQECINQEDPAEKEEAVQVMDIVYEQGDCSVVVLDTYLSTQAQVDALTRILSEDVCEPELISDLTDVFEMLVDDHWFQRAWTLQESTAAGARTTLLIACNPNLERPDRFDKTPGEIEIGLWDFQLSMVWVRSMVEQMENDKTLQSTLTADEVDEWHLNLTHCSSIADIIFNCMPEITSSADNYRVSSQKRGCSAALALTYLDDRQNSWFPDRLAILGNLCNFDIRIPSDVITLSGFGFSMCALTLATLNGDMSLWTRYLVGNRMDKNGYSHLDEHISAALNMLERSKDGRYNQITAREEGDTNLSPHGFSWCPPAAGSLSNITYFEEYDEWFRLRPATLHESGLRISGMLWRVDQLIPVPCTRRCHMSTWLTSEEKPLETGGIRWDAATKKFLIEHPQRVTVDIVWHLLREVFHAGFLELAKTLWAYFRPVGKEASWYEERSCKTYHKSFQEIFDKDSCAHNSSSDSQDCPHHLESIELFGVEDMSKGGGVHPYTLTKTLLDQVFNTGSILCARPVRSVNAANDSESIPFVVFENSSENELVFTPSTELGDSICSSIWGGEFTAWTAEPTRGDTVEGCEVLRCVGRRRGIWRIADFEPKEYIFA